MCPICDTKCDFWYLGHTCNFAHVSFSIPKLHPPHVSSLCFFCVALVIVLIASNMAAYIMIL